MKSETSDPDFSDQQTKFRGPQQKQTTSSATEKNKTDEVKLSKFERNLPFAIKSQNQLNVIQRTIWTIILLFALFILIIAGSNLFEILSSKDMYMSVSLLFLLYWVRFLLIIFQKGMFHEIISLKRVKEKDVQVPFFGALNWYFFFVGIFFTYGKLFTNKLTQFLDHNHILLLIEQYHTFAGFMFWVIGFLIFVLQLKQGFYRYQFRQFGWVHFTILFIISSSAAILQNLFEGMIWMLLPALLVISNDTFAYIFGKFFGKTQLISLSPKKTWEGFIGGFLSTVVIAILIATYFSQYDYLICPQTDLVFTPFLPLTCETPAVFIKQQYFLPQLFKTFGLTEIWLSKFQMHAVVWSFFASFVAPFGGFFASGFKRAIKIKDFADTIPGHGGITDRMDCQILTVKLV